MKKFLHTKYAQKSRFFLYPLLGIKRGSAVVPIESYISLLGHVKPEDKKLVCLYDQRVDLEFRQFEKNKLLNNPKFVDYHELKDDKCVYIFDLSDEGNVWDCFMNGTYSKFNAESKVKILNFFSNHPGNRDLVNSFLNPEGYFDIYAKLLDVPISLLEEVGELCDLPDIDQETLKINIKEMQFDYL
jgi:hypothetical protein